MQREALVARLRSLNALLERQVGARMCACVCSPPCVCEFMLPCVFPPLFCCAMVDDKLTLTHLMAASAEGDTHHPLFG